MEIKELLKGLTERELEVLKEAALTLYLNDRSDFRSALYEIISILLPEGEWNVEEIKNELCD